MNGYSLMVAGLSGNNEKEKGSESGLVAAVSRSGNRTEALGGPLLYALALLVTTVVFYRDSCVGVVAMSQLAAGDGMADLVGRRFGTVFWPSNKEETKKKSVQGSVAFLLSAWLCSYGMVWWLHYHGCLQLSVAGQGVELVARLGCISLVCSVAEVLSTGGMQLLCCM